jgi:hypothetical protein
MGPDRSMVCMGSLVARTWPIWPIILVSSLVAQFHCEPDQELNSFTYPEAGLTLKICPNVDAVVMLSALLTLGMETLKRSVP